MSTAAELDHVVRLLVGTMESDPQARAGAEAGLEAGAAQSGFGLALVTVATAPGLPAGVKQLALLCLKKTIKARGGFGGARAHLVSSFTDSPLTSCSQEHWSPSAPRFREPQVSEGEKGAVRARLLVDGLKDGVPRVRVAASLAIAAVYALEGADGWPALVPSLVAQLGAAPSLDAAHGALRCLSLLADDLDEASLPALLPALFPALHAVVSAARAPPPLVRRALCVLHASLATLAFLPGDTSGQKKAAALLAPYFPGWVATLSRVVGAPLRCAEPAACGAQVAALRCLARLLAFFPRPPQQPNNDDASEVVDAPLNAAMSLLTRASEAHASFLVDPPTRRSGGGTPSQDAASADAGADSDGTEEGLAPLCGALLEFFSDLLPLRRFGPPLCARLPPLVACTLGLMRVTAADEARWACEPGSFAADEEEARARSCLRIVLLAPSSSQKNFPHSDGHALTLRPLCRTRRRCARWAKRCSTRSSRSCHLPRRPPSHPPSTRRCCRAAPANRRSSARPRQAAAAAACAAGGRRARRRSSRSGPSRSAWPSPAEG